MERCIKGSLFHVCVSCRAGWLLGKPHFLVYFTGAPVQIYHQGTVWRRVQMCGVCHGELGTEGQVQCVLWSFLLPSKSPSTGSLWVSSLVESHWHKLWWGLVPVGKEEAHEWRNGEERFTGNERSSIPREKERLRVHSFMLRVHHSLGIAKASTQVSRCLPANGAISLFQAWVCHQGNERFSPVTWRLALTCPPFSSLFSFGRNSFKSGHLPCHALPHFPHRIDQIFWNWKPKIISLQVIHSDILVTEI